MAATDNRALKVMRVHFRRRALARTINPDRQALLSRSAARRPSGASVRRSPMRLLALALTLALTVALAGACGGAPSAPAAAPAAAPVPVVVEVASPGLLGRGVDAIGVIAARESVEIRPETSGVIQATSFEDGDVVKRGAVLARLCDAD